MRSKGKIIKVISTILLLQFFSTFLPFTPPVNAQFLDYQVTVSTLNVEAGKQFTLKISLKNNTTTSFYKVSVYLYQGHNIFNCSVEDVNPSYNANYSDPQFSTIYNPKYWITDSIIPGQTSTYQVTYSVSPSAEEGYLKTIGHRPITQGKPLQDAIDNPTSELLVDISYYSDEILTPPAKTIRTYIDLPTVTQPLSQIASKKLPSIFTAPGTQTTKLSDIKANQAENFSNFTLDTANGNMIVWLDPLNLNDSQLLSKIEIIDKYVFITQIGTISVDPVSAPFFNKKAKIIFKNIHFLSPPKLLKDEQQVDEEIQKTGVCDKNSESCYFVVPGFSTYSIQPILKIDIPESIQTQELLLTGYVNDIDAKVTYRLNNTDWKDTGPVDIETGRFTINITLLEGTNTFNLIAKSKNGKSSEVNKTLVYNPQKSSVPKQDEDQDKSQNIVLIILEGGIIVLAVIIAAIMWWLIYKNIYKNRKKEIAQKVGETTKDTKVALPSTTTKILSKDSIPKWPN